MKTTRPIIVVLNLDASLSPENKAIVLDKFIGPLNQMLVEGESMTIYEDTKKFLADQVLDLMASI